MFTRATTLADAFITATAKKMKTEKVDHQTGAGNWIARKVILNTERGKFGTVTEFDKRPVDPRKKAAMEAPVNKPFLVHEEDLSDVPY